MKILTLANKNIEKSLKQNFDSPEEDIISADKSFTTESFLQGAEKAFKIIVSSYKENNIQSAQSLLSPKVLKLLRNKQNSTE